MSTDSQRNEESTTLKTYLVSGLYAVVGVAGAALVDHFTHELPHQPWWVGVVQNIFAIIAGTGFIGILFELALRRSLITETLVRLKTLFDEDTQFAERLSPAARERRVDNTLKAHLGPELGHAIFLGLVHRYFLEQNREKFRKEARYLVTLSACTDMKVNTFLAAPGLRPDAYSGLLADYSFRVNFEHAGTLSVVCTLSEDMADLYEVFRRSDCICREVIQMEIADRDAIVEALKAASGEDQRRKIIASIARVDLVFNGSELPSKSIRFVEANLSLVFEFDASGRPTNPDHRDKYQILIRSIFARSIGIFPIVVADPTYDPVMQLCYPDPRILQVASSPFITSDAPFEPRIDHDVEARKITIDTTSANGEPGWVFPSSGVIFTWKSC